MTVSEKHYRTARTIADGAIELYRNFEIEDLARKIASALAAAEREGREDERKRCAVLCEHFAQQWDTGGINGKPNDGFNACMQARDAILSEIGEA